MASQVQSIVTQALSIASGYLGAQWKELRYTLEIDKNDIRSGYQAYGFRPLEATSADGVTGHYTLNHRFELILCSTFARSDSDAGIYTVLYNLYDKSDEILKLFLHSRLNIPTTVLLISDEALSEPEVLREVGLVVLRQQFTIRYRQAVP